MNHTEDSHDNAESTEADVQLEEASVSIGLKISAGKNNEFHTLNDPSAPIQRSTITDRQGIIQVQCFSKDIIHGYLSPEEDNATLLVYDLHLDTAKRSRRIRRATIKFEFKGSGNAFQPEVEKIAPFRRTCLLATSAEESTTHGYGATVGVNQIANIEGSATWGKTVAQTTDDSARVTGRICSDKYGKGVGAEWILFENESIDSGTPSYMRFLILLNRGESEENFECKVTINVKADWKTSVGELVGFTPRDDPILFDPTFPSTNKLRKPYDIENLGSLDMEELVKIDFGKDLRKEIEGGLARFSSTGLSRS